MHKQTRRVSGLILALQLSTISFAQNHSIPSKEDKKYIFSGGTHKVDGQEECLCKGVNLDLPNNACVRISTDFTKLYCDAKSLENMLMVDSYGKHLALTQDTCLFDCLDTKCTSNEKNTRTRKPIKPFTVTNDPTILAQRPHGPHFFLSNAGARIVLKLAMITRDYESESVDDESGGEKKYDPFGIVALPEKALQERLIPILSEKYQGLDFDYFYSTNFLASTDKTISDLRFDFKKVKDALLNQNAKNLSAGIVPVFLNDKRGTLHGTLDVHQGKDPFECESIVSTLAGPQLMYYNSPGLPIANWDLARLADDDHILFYLEAGDGPARLDDIMAIFKVSVRDLKSKSVVYKYTNTVGGTDLVVVVQIISD